MMSKYSELCEKMADTFDAIEESKLEFTNIFTEKLSEYLGCEKGAISLLFVEPNVESDSIKHSFRLDLNLIGETWTSTVGPEHSLDCFVHVWPDSSGYSFMIRYKMMDYGVDKDLNELLDKIFEDLQRHMIS
jgi:hypothetical protein